MSLPASYLSSVGQAQHRGGNSARGSQAAVSASLWWEGLPGLDQASTNSRMFPVLPSAAVTLSCPYAMGWTVYNFFSHTKWHSVCTAYLGDLTLCGDFNFRESVRG